MSLVLVGIYHFWRIINRSTGHMAINGAEMGLNRQLQNREMKYEEVGHDDCALISTRWPAAPHPPHVPSSTCPPHPRCDPQPCEHLRRCQTPLLGLLGAKINPSILRQRPQGFLPTLTMAHISSKKPLTQRPTRGRWTLSFEVCPPMACLPMAG